MLQNMENLVIIWKTERLLIFIFNYAIHQQICLGCGMGRGSDDESIGDEQEPPRNPQVPKCLKMRPDPMEQFKAQPLRKVRSSADPKGTDDQLQPQTKSEVI